MENNRFALVQFLASLANSFGVGDHVYVVGGAVRNYVSGWEVKDFDLAFDQVSLGQEGQDSEWFARQVQKHIPAKSSLVTNQYGVAILTIASSWMLDGTEMRGEVIEIANARKESYGGEGGKGYKPHMVEPATILEDLVRREFTFNTLMWRLSSLEHGPKNAPVLDLLGCGMQDLRDGRVRTPRDPDITFSDDPTRTLRAVKFVIKYNFSLSEEVRWGIIRNREKLRNMPWDAVRKIVVEDILLRPGSRGALRLMNELGLSQVLGEMMTVEDGFAAAVGREMANVHPSLALDIHDVEWPVRTSVSFLDAPSRRSLREILESKTEQEGISIHSALQKPSINQQRLFGRYSIPPKERGCVIQMARASIVADSSLAFDAARLEQVVETMVAVVYSRAESTS